MPYGATLVSHAHFDHGKCDPVVAALRERGIKIDYDSDRPLAPQVVHSAIPISRPDIVRYDTLIVMVTPAALDSLRVEEEIAAFAALVAQDPSRRLIPVLLDPCELPPLLARQPWKVDATTLTPTQAADQLLAELEAVNTPTYSPLAKTAAPMDSSPVVISRRALVVAGLVSAAGLAAIGTGALWRARTSSKTATSHATATPLSPFTYGGHADDVLSVAWSPDGKRIVSGGFDRTVQVWNAADGGDAVIYRDYRGLVTSVAWSPDGHHIASASWPATVLTWDAADGGNVFSYDNVQLPDSLAWSPGSRRIACGGRDATVQVWDATDGGNVFIYQGYSGAVFSIAWSPDGKRIASANYDGTVQVWDAADGAHVLVYRGHSQVVSSVAWSPDGRRIASTAYDDSSVHVWDAANGRPTFVYLGHSAIVKCLAWSPDSKRIASGSRDSTVHVWDAANGRHAFIHGRAGLGQALAWAPNGLNIASSGDGGTVEVWIPR